MERTFDLTEIDSVARELLEASHSRIFAFYGEMGAGKTTLIKSLIRILGADDIGTSPTFSLVNEYESERGVIYHFDFYRIEDENEALDIGIEDYLSSGGWIFIEWPDKIRKFLPEGVQKVEISNIDKNSRVLKFS